MKKILLAITLAVSLLGLDAKAQDTNSPVTGQTAWDFLTTGSNYWAAPFATISTGDKTIGGGIAIGYRATEFIHPIIRLDYFGGSVYMPSLTAQLQPPRSFMGKIPILPFGIVGGGLPIAGAAENNGKFVSIIGAGAAIKLDMLGSSWFWKHSFIAADYEVWNGLEQKQRNQIRLAAGITF